jgi:hypothetical protein
MNRRGIQFGTVVLLAAVLSFGAERRLAALPSVSRFVTYYEAIERTDSSMGVWERVVSSLVLTKARAESKAAPPRKSCST